MLNLILKLVLIGVMLYWAVGMTYSAYALYVMRTALKYMNSDTKDENINVQSTTIDEES